MFNPIFTGPYKGIIQAKRALNDLHLKLGRDGFSEVFVDQLDPDVLAVTRHDPKSHQSVVLVAHTAFNNGVDINRASTGLWLNVEADLIEVEIEAKLYKVKDQEFVQDENIINGLENFFVDLKTHLDIKDKVFQSIQAEEILEKKFFHGCIWVIPNIPWSKIKISFWKEGARPGPGAPVLKNEFGV